MEVSGPAFFPSFTERTNQLEHLDKGDYTAEEYEGCIVELKRVNRWLGDAHALRTTLLKEIHQSKLREFSVLDVGAGSGELLRVIAQWSTNHNKFSQLVGLEFNARSAQAIRTHSGAFQNISSVRADAFQLPFAEAAFDYVMCSLFTHHFGNEDVVTILEELARVTRVRLFVIDLRRHPVAYYFYITVGRLFLHNRLVREDGALSILRSFMPGELFDLAKRAGLKNIKVEQRFPYRLVLSANPRH